MERYASNGKNVQRVVESVALLFKAPRTSVELADAMDCHRGQATRYLQMLHGEGLVYVAEWKRAARSDGCGRFMAVYAWQPSVCERPDVPHPRKKQA